jgi:hypothetical protein
MSLSLRWKIWESLKYRYPSIYSIRMLIRMLLFPETEVKTETEIKLWPWYWDPKPTEINRR